MDRSQDLDSSLEAEASSSDPSTTDADSDAFNFTYHLLAAESAPSLGT